MGVCRAGQALQRGHARARDPRRTGARRRGAPARGPHRRAAGPCLRADDERAREARHPRQRCRRPDRHHRPQHRARRIGPALPAQGHVPQHPRERLARVPRTHCRPGPGAARAAGSLAAGKTTARSRRRGRRACRARGSASASTTSRSLRLPTVLRETTNEDQLSCRDRRRRAGVADRSLRGGEVAVAAAMEAAASGAPAWGPAPCASR